MAFRDDFWPPVPGGNDVRSVFDSASDPPRSRLLRGYPTWIPEDVDIGRKMVDYAMAGGEQWFGSRTGEGGHRMSLVDFRLEDNVAVLTMQDGENRFNPPFLGHFLSVLDEIENGTNAQALVVTSGHEKIFCNGIDLDWLIPFIRNNDTATAQSFFSTMMDLFKRILLYPMPTIAAISGHAFAGGAIMSCAFDFRFMRSDRGYFCFPEVDLGIPFLPGMIAIIRKAIPAHIFDEMQFTGMRCTAEVCERHGIIRKALLRDRLMEEALNFAKGLKKGRKIIAEMKRRTHRGIVRVLEQEDPPLIDSGVFYV